MNIINPILPGFYPDPSVCRAGDDFYLVTSSFEFFPGVPIFHSRNLVNWHQIGHCLTRPSQLSLRDVDISGGIYAPTLRYLNGRFYMITTNESTGSNFIVWADDPSGEWSDPIRVDVPGIDPDLFMDDDGHVYFSCSEVGTGITQCRMDINTGRILSEPVRTWTGTGGKYPEAPHVYHVSGKYYLVIAEGGTEYGHCVTVARGDSPTGPWESCPDNPILTHRSTNLPIQATGHADLIEDPNGHWWAVCLGIRPLGYHPYHILGRETFLAPVSWEGGWPVIGESRQIALEMTGHSGLPMPEARDFSTVDRFDGRHLPLYWNFLGNPAPGSWSLRNGRLVLECSESNLDTMERQSWVGRRQQHFRFRVTAHLEFNPASDAEEAGITVFQNIRHHYEIALTRRNGKNCLITRRTIGTLREERMSSPVPEGSLMLTIEGNEDEYRLGLIGEESDRVFLQSGENRYLSTETGGRFTGVYLAMYATANGHRSANSAGFRRFEYEVLKDSTLAGGSSLE